MRYAVCNMLGVCLIPLLPSTAGRRYNCYRAPDWHSRYARTNVTKYFGCISPVTARLVVQHANTSPIMPFSKI